MSIRLLRAPKIEVLPMWNKRFRAKGYQETLAAIGIIACHLVVQAFGSLSWRREKHGRSRKEKYPHEKTVPPSKVKTEISIKPIYQNQNNTKFRKKLLYSQLNTIFS